MRTLQSGTDLDDNGDKSDLPSMWRRFLIAHIEKVDTRPFVPTNLIPMVGSFQKLRNCVRPMIKESYQIT